MAENTLDEKFGVTIRDLNTDFQRTSQILTEQAVSHERLIKEEISTFKEEVRRELSEHQQAIDRQLTDFLNKQNAMVQNLIQQIDSYQRAAQIVSADLSQVKTQIGETATVLQSYETSLIELRSFLGEFQNNSARQDAELKRVNGQLQQFSAQLEDTVTRLKRRLGWLSGLK